MEPANKFIRKPNITHGSAYKNAVVQRISVRDTVVYYREENYKTDSEIWNEDSKLQFEQENIETSRPPLDSTPVHAKEKHKKSMYQRTHIQTQVC